ncbi:RecQ family ATP-dependent DNA helicase [Pseudoxanthomonas sp. SGD-10]|nr:RecQ family ATP-dependent DNA helicase [Pseudoxanthomonas sp. SGD-10]
MSIQQILKQYWGYDSFRPLQENIITSIMDKYDTLALLPTGGGKSVCFQVPALAMDGICIVVSPLIALMKDQVENLQARGVQALAIISGMGKREIDIVLDNCVYGPVKFLYISPERLMTDLVRERIKYMNVNLFAIDEAHCISQWGYDFRPPYLRIKELRELHPDVPILALTASATEKVQQDIMEKLAFKEDARLFKKSFARQNLSYAVLHLENKLQKLVDICRNVKGSGIVYVRTRKDTVEIAKFLNQHKIPALYYHAGLDSDSRSQTQKSWINDKVKVIVATNAFGMGIDKPNVRFVVHYEMPESPEAYYQEAGRAGRDGEKAYAVLLHQELDTIVFKKRFEQNFPPIEYIKKVYHFLCNYLQIPIGAGEGIVYNFNIGDFCARFQLEVISTISAIKTLEHNGYIILSENALLPSRLQFLVDGEDLYKFQVQHAKYDLFIKSILRLYGAAFDRFIAIKESEISKKNALSTTEVYAMLEELHNLEVVNYIRQTDHPLVTFLQQRYPTENLHIDAKYYAGRKEVFAEKMTAILNYVSLNICRSKQLLTYFDELDAEECGVCDVCIANKKSAELKNKISEGILKALEGKQLILSELVNAVELGTEDDRLAVIRVLLDAGDIKKSGDHYHL